MSGPIGESETPTEWAWRLGQHDGRKANRDYVKGKPPKTPVQNQDELLAIFAHQLFEEYEFGFDSMLPNID